MGKKVTITLDLENGQFVTKMKKADNQMTQFAKTATSVRHALMGAFTFVAGRQIVNWAKSAVSAFVEFEKKQAESTGRMNQTAQQIIGMTKEWDRMKISVGEGIAAAFVEAADSMDMSTEKLKKFNTEMGKVVSYETTSWLLHLGAGFSMVAKAMSAVARFGPVGVGVATAKLLKGESWSNVKRDVFYEPDFSAEMEMSSRALAYSNMAQDRKNHQAAVATK